MGLGEVRWGWYEWVEKGVWVGVFFFGWLYVYTQLDLQGLSGVGPASEAVVKGAGKTLVSHYAVWDNFPLRAACPSWEENCMGFFLCCFCSASERNASSLKIQEIIVQVFFSLLCVNRVKDDMSLRSTKGLHVSF